MPKTNNLLTQISRREYKKGLIFLHFLQPEYYILAGICCPKCGLIDIDRNDIYDPLAGAWQCPRCSEIVIWANNQMITHFGSIRRKIGWGKFWNVNALLEKSRKRD